MQKIYNFIITLLLTCSIPFAGLTAQKPNDLPEIMQG